MMISLDSDFFMDIPKISDARIDVSGVTWLLAWGSRSKILSTYGVESSMRGGICVFSSGVIATNFGQHG